MKFYINGVEEKVEINPQLSRAIDTTNDSFNCVLKAKTNETPYPPMTPFNIQFDDGTIKYMWIISDSVSVFSTNPKTYKHSISAVQYRYFLNKHLIRNTIFTQPRIKKGTLYGAISSGLVYDDSVSPKDVFYRTFSDTATDYPIWWSDTFYINSHSHIRNVRFKIEMYGVNQLNDSTMERITSLDGSNAHIRDTARFRIVDTLNNDYVISTMYIDEATDEWQLSIREEEAINEYIDSRNAPVSLFMKYESGYVVPPYPAPSYSLAEQGSVIVIETRTETADFDPWTDTKYTAIAVHILYEFDVYTYTMYDVIETLLNQYKQTTLEEGDKKEPLFTMPDSSSDLYTLLKTTYPPDVMSFTQATFYDALTHIFRFYDAGFKFVGSNHQLEIEYYNDLENEVEPDFTGMSLEHSSSNYNNGRVNFYQNAVQKTDLNSVGVRCQSLGVPAQSDFGLVLPKPIYDIDKVELLFWGDMAARISSVWACNYQAADFWVDVSRWFINKDLWTTLDPKSESGTWDRYDLIQINTIPYERGSNFICVSNYYSNFLGQQQPIMKYVITHAMQRFWGNDSGNTKEYPDISTWEEQFFNVSYFSLLNGKVRTETAENQYLGEILTNQSDGLVDLEKLGSAMYSESLRDGVPTLTVSCAIDNADTVKEGDYIYYNNEIWVATYITTTYYNGGQKCDVLFSKNFNATNLVIHSDKEKRLTSISGNLATMSEDNFVDYLYVSSNQVEGNPIILRSEFIMNSLNKTFSLDWYDERYKSIDFGVVKNDSSWLEASADHAFFDSFLGILIESFLAPAAQIASLPFITNSLWFKEYCDDNGLDAASYGYIAGDGKYVYCPVVKYNAGNCLCFEFQYNDPVNSFNRLDKENGWFGSSKYFSKATPYTEEDGFKDVIELTFSEETPYGHPNFPLVDFYTDVGKITLDYYKKPNEIFGLNYELCVLVNPEEINTLFVGKEFMKENGFIKLPTPKTFRLYYSTEDKKYSILDREGFGDYMSVSLSIAEESNYNYCLTIHAGDTIPEGTKSWALCDEFGNIYIAKNYELHAYEYIYLTPRWKRL